MNVRDIYNFINEFAPFDTAAGFDNAGFLIGDKNAEVTGITVALDCYSAVIDEAVKNGCNLIVTHHPVIFDPLKKITADSRVYKLIKNGISVISAHTNLDAADGGVNDCLANKIGLFNVTGAGETQNGVFEYRIGEINAMSADDFAAHLAKVLNVRVKYCGKNGNISRVAICGGSGGSLLFEAAALGADALVTADCKHSVFVDADEFGTALFDCGHFNTEDVVTEPLGSMIRKKFKDIPVFTSHYTNIKYR